MKNLLLLLSLLLLSNYATSQNHGRFWYFGQNAGLDFSTSPPTALNNGQLDTFESCSTISDDLGNLLFYTDGSNVWNANHVLMTNGTGLNGNASAAQQLIVRNRVTTNEFYILSVSSANGLSYSIVDMLMDNGLGDIDPNRKNILMNPNAREKVTAYINPSVNLNWIITFDAGVYYAHRLQNGVIDILNPVVSTLTTTSVLTDARGMLKLSPDGNKIVNTSIGNAGSAYLADFNTLTGQVSNPIGLSSSSNLNRFYGAEFSPDSRLVYLNANIADTGNGCGQANVREIFQYEINGSSGWNSNPIELGGSNNGVSGRGSLQLAPDGKIYFARTCKPWLGVILNPTVIGTGATYIDNGVALDQATNSREGLPNIATQPYSVTFNTIKGTIRLDLDGNGCTVADPEVPNTLFTITSTNFNSYSFSNSSGEYLSTVPNGSFTVAPLSQYINNWTLTPPNFTVNFPTQASPFTQDFCLTPNGVVEDLEVAVIPLQQARPGFYTDYKVVINNKGNQTASGSVTLDFEEDFMTLISTNPNAGNTPSNQLSWSFSNLQPFQMEEYEFTMMLNTPTHPTNPLNFGDILIFTGIVTGTGSDITPADNTMVLDQIAVNSYDPNDKICLEGETIDPADIGEYVHYMIRFENIGTASAVNVVIKDEINLAQFDISTLAPISSSHEYYTNIKDGNLVEFVFEDINLDFNDATNDGYVLFKIKTINTLVAGDTFDNTAEIFFDFNFPIITNTETVTVMSTASVGESIDSSIKVYPNPAKSFINLYASNSLESVTIMDINGRTLSQTNFTGNSTDQSVSIENLSSGIYFVTIQSDLGQKVEKLMVE
ncbi:MAG: T9SS type A sorting domain-containing protein [Nonlabens ulvanivorans]|uniref:T9SS type A sorting domain-containing protein n=1 Tax=Nonlabens ulvanivorans TaxID=906888 RepID=UPI0032674B3C